MKITTETEIYIVINPGPDSVLEDIFLKTDMHDLELLIIGAFPERMTDKNMVIYGNRDEAMKDARARILALSYD